MLVLAGALAGGAAGYFLFGWVAQQGFYALILPGGLLGLGAGLARNRSIAVAVVCGVLALALGVVTEYQFFPFAADGSFSFFMAHLFDLSAITLIMIAVGGFIGFWVPFGRIEKGRR